jgi:hypothetical protein
MDNAVLNHQNLPLQGAVPPVPTSLQLLIFGRKDGILGRAAWLHVLVEMRHGRVDMLMTMRVGCGVAGLSMKLGQLQDLELINAMMVQSEQPY